MLTLATVCSGIGAPEVALHAIGYCSLWCSQFDPDHDYKRGPDFPSAVLAHRFPELTNHGDFTQLLKTPPASPDVLIGGTPCQSFSVAGLREGLSDPRGGLMLAFVSLVALLRPRWVVWENVPGVLSSDDGRAFGSLLSGLGICGYGWAYRVLDAQYFGVAQRRERVFVVGHSGGDWRRAGAVLFEPEGVRWNSPPRREAGKGVAGTLGASASGRGWRCGADEVAAGQAVAFGIGDEIGRSLNAHPSRYDSETETLIAHTLRGNGHDAGEDGTGRGPPLVPIAFDTTQITSKTNRSQPQAGAPCHTLNGNAHPPAIAYTSDGYVADPLQANEARTYANEGSNNFRLHNCVDQRLGVRRTTPREQERLQGFPDDWTLIPWKGKPANQCPDGPRSKALGNAMAVPVVRWIGERIRLVDMIP